MPPITDTTRSTLVKKLNQLDQQKRQTTPRKPGTGMIGLDAGIEDLDPSVSVLLCRIQLQNKTKTKT